MPKKEKAFILAFGSNLTLPQYSRPEKVIMRSIRLLEYEGFQVIAQGGLYRSEPVPRSDQPWYTNTVVKFAANASTGLDAQTLLDLVLDLELRMGRKRLKSSTARLIDIDLIDFEGQVQRSGLEAINPLEVPHPRMHERAFVLLPLRDIDPGWCHPVSGLSVEELISNSGSDFFTEQRIFLVKKI